MKRYLYAFLTMLLGLSFSSCNNEMKQTDDFEHYIDVISESVFDVDYKENILYVEIDANCSWNISKTDADGNAISWLKTNVASGKGPMAFKIKASKNKTEKARSGIVNIYSDQITAYIDVNQAANPDPDAEPEQFKGYTMPVYEMFESSLGLDVTSGNAVEMDCAFTNASVDGNVITFNDGLVIEKTGSTPADFKMLCPSHKQPDAYAGFQLGIAASFGAGESWIYKIPVTYALSGDLRFTYGSRKEGISSAEPYQWSSDEGLTWNSIDRMEAVKSDGAFKSIWFTIPDSKKVPSEGSLWIKVAQTAEKVYIQNGIALEKASAGLSQLPSQNNETVVIAEGFDSTVDANASYLTVPGFMKSATTGYTAAGNDTDPYVSANPAISVNHCFARPGFLQVGYSDEALKARCGWNGAVTLNVGARLQEMGITGKVALKVSFNAAAMTNAFGRQSDAAIVLKNGDVEVASVGSLQADVFNLCKLTVPEADQSTMLTITSKPCSKQGDGTAATSYEAADYRFFIDDLLVEVSTEPGSMELRFDFTDAAAMASWPQAQTPDGCSTTERYDCPYTLDGVDYHFIATQPLNVTTKKYPYFNVNRLTIPTQRYLGLPVVEGYRLTKVVADVLQTSGDTEARYLVVQEVGSGTANPPTVAGGEEQKGVAGQYVFVLTETQAGVQYWFKVWGTAAALSGMTLTYEK